MSTEPALVLAARAGDHRRVRELLGADASTANASGAGARTALHEAAERNDRLLAEMLLDAGADPERETEWGDTPLEWAGLIGATDVALLLLERGAGRYDLVTAAGIGRLDDVRRFLRTGETTGRPRSRQEDAARTAGWRPDCARVRGDVLSDALVLACRNGHLDVAKLLLAERADVDARGFFGAPAIHWAAIHGHDAVVDLLLENGADPALRDGEFDADAASWALEGGHRSLADRLAARTD